MVVWADQGRDSGLRKRISTKTIRLSVAVADPSDTAAAAAASTAEPPAMSPAGSSGDAAPAAPAPVSTEDAAAVANAATARAVAKEKQAWQAMGDMFDGPADDEDDDH